jgi:hypothetical protein
MKLKFTFTSLGVFFNFIERGSSVRPVFFRMGSGSDSDPVEGFISQQRKGGRRKYIIAPVLILRLYY